MNDEWKVLGPELVKVLGLPKNTKSLRVAVDEAIIVECEFYPDLDNSKTEELTIAMNKYKLVKIDESGTA